MAQREKRSDNQTKYTNLTFDSSVSDSFLKENTLCLEDDDPPVVFLCGKCKLPIGDSLSWDGCEDDENQIRIRRATDNVIVGKETRMLEAKKGSTCSVVDLVCRGCHTTLGMSYTSTPPSLDHKRLRFCFNVARIDSYVLGSAGQVLTAGGAQEQPVTPEYRSSVEHQMTEMKMLVLSLAQRLETIEFGLDRSDVASK